MRKIVSTGLFVLSITAGLAQDPTAKIKESVTKTSAESHLAFLASDEMRGRGTGSPEIAIASQYIAMQFKLDGVKRLPGMDSYFQEVGLREQRPAKSVEVKIGNDVFTNRQDLLVLRGKSFHQEADVVFVGYGTPEDLKNVDVAGKIVVAYTGNAADTTARQSFMAAREKRRAIQEKGGIALIEIAAFNNPPWQILNGYFAGSRVTLAGEGSNDNTIPHLWMKKSNAEGISTLIRLKSAKGTVTIETPEPTAIPGRNVVGVIEGTDPKLKHEYIVLSAHYDHLGVQKNASGDSIYNGARDNGIGTTAILEAAKFFGRNPTKRSLIVLAFCGEEKGLLGSSWYASHPLVPLSQTVYNLDCDGAGYNDKEIATLIDLNRTTADASFTKACAAFGLGLKGDPVPEQDLYERSDNFNFADKGVPAVDFSTGVKSFDEELMKYYHQPADEVSSLDFDYLEKFFRAYVYSAFLIGNAPARPFWKPGDKFEATGKALYGIK
jgi:hypothetical protein